MELGGYSDTAPKEILKHFGVELEELQNSETIVFLNKEKTREHAGAIITKKCLGLKKARITIDYDADFDFILMRITPL